MASPTQANGDSGIESQQLTLDFDGGNFTTTDIEDKKQWISSVVRIEEQKAKTRVQITLILVGALILSFPAYVVALYLLPETKQEVVTGFTQWLAVVGSLTGAAVGVGALANRKNQ